MKFIAALVSIAAAVTAVTARPSETNAGRLARGLPPLPPVRRASPVAAARRAGPSGINNSCNTGPVQCCNSVTTFNEVEAAALAKVVGFFVPHDVAVKTTCSPLSVIGLGGNSCNSQPVCCENNDFTGLVAVGCSPININL